MDLKHSHVINLEASDLLKVHVHKSGILLTEHISHRMCEGEHRLGLGTKLGWAVHICSWQRIADVKAPLTWQWSGTHYISRQLKEWSYIMHTPDDCSQLLLPVSNFVSFSRCSCSWSGFYYIFAAILVGRHAGQDGFTRPLWALRVPPATPIRGEGDALEGWEWQRQVGPILAWLCSNSGHCCWTHSWANLQTLIACGMFVVGWDTSRTRLAVASGNTPVHFTLLL